MATPDWVVVGADVFVVSGYYPRFQYAPAKIAKVHKNGNLVLEGNPQQYKPFERYAIATGSGWHKNTVEPATDKVRAKAATAIVRENLANKASALARRFDVIARSGEASVSLLAFADETLAKLDEVAP